MINAIFTSAAVLAMSTIVHAQGRAVVVNQCSETVSLDNVPASGGGQNAIIQSIPSGGSYSQQWTSLSNGQGWSMKLTPNAGSADVVQYEYTYHDDGLIWYDISAVNGDPFDGNWFISASGSCNPRQASYRYPTDDTYGMQDACPSDSTITVTLCPSGSGAAPAGSAGSAAPAAGSAAPAASSAAPAAPSAAPSQPEAGDRAPNGGATQQPDADMPTASVATVPYPSIDASANVKIEDGGINTFDQPAAASTVTNVQTKVVTQWVTISPSPVKRSEHLRRHVRVHDHA